MFTDPRTPDRPVYYKLTLWAFGSGELKNWGGGVGRGGGQVGGGWVGGGVTKYSTHHSLSANTGFKSLAFILFEILHLQNCHVKFQNFQRAITKKYHMNFFLNFTI